MSIIYLKTFFSSAFIRILRQLSLLACWTHQSVLDVEAGVTVADGGGESLLLRCYPPLAPLSQSRKPPRSQQSTWRSLSRQGCARQYLCRQVLDPRYLRIFARRKGYHRRCQAHAQSPRAQAAGGRDEPYFYSGPWEDDARSL
ncbi:hypothetical protein FB451DRAFT_418902 [Mycena latifolia]|nr:hypothetical protein FB451DRAFT_418902 [Mycena latifolia]